MKFFLLAAAGVLLYSFINSGKRLLNLLVSVSNVRIHSLKGSALTLYLTVDVINPNQNDVFFRECSGTSDNIHARLSAGESVNNAFSTSMFAPLYSSLNQMGGGVPIYAQDVFNKVLGENMLANALSQALLAMPAPVVSVEEIQRVSKNIKVAEKLSLM